ncbi:MAG TPA: hypothetical protein VIJ68_04490 [Candidatus Saccharimonadales bacterium]
MFGHHDDDDKQHDDSAPLEGVDQAVETEDVPAGQPAEPAATIAPDASTVHSNPAPTDDTQVQPWQHPGTPIGDDQGQISDVISPAGGFPKRPSYQYAKGVPEPGEPKGEAAADNPADRELLDVKEHALEELAPLLDKLDLPPEEKFRAIMMILQADDDKSMVKAAYAAAHAIEDEEIRAQALFTIVNEVDYFTHQDTTQS